MPTPDAFESQQLELEEKKAELLDSLKSEIKQLGSSHKLPVITQEKLVEQALDIIDRMLDLSPTRRDKVTIQFIVDQWEKVKNQFVANLSLMLKRVQHDMSFLAKTFLANAVNPILTNIILTESDPHKRGKTVIILEFESESSAKKCKVVYKPSSVSLDAMVIGDLKKLSEIYASYKDQMSMAEIFNQFSQHAIPTYLVVPCKDDHSSIEIDNHYGYVEFIQQNPSFKLPSDNLAEIEMDVLKESYHSYLMSCVNMEDCDFILRSQSECDRYSYVCGMTTALVLAISGTDMHYENMIVRGKLPHLLDVECSLNPTAEFSVDNTGLLYDSSGKCAFEPYARRDVEIPGKAMLELPEKNLVYYHDKNTETLISYAPENTMFQLGLKKGLEIIAMQPTAGTITVYDWFSQRNVLSLLARFLPCSTQEFLRTIKQLASHDYSTEIFKEKIIPGLVTSLALTAPTTTIFDESNTDTLYDEMSAHSVPWYYMRAAGTELYDFNSRVVATSSSGAEQSYFAATPLDHAKSKCITVQRAFDPDSHHPEDKKKVDEVVMQCEVSLKRVAANNGEMPLLIDISYFKQYEKKVLALKSQLPSEDEEALLVGDFLKDVRSLMRSQAKWLFMLYKPMQTYYQWKVDIRFELDYTDTLWKAYLFINSIQLEKKLVANLTPERIALLESILKIAEKYHIEEKGKEIGDIKDQLYKLPDELYKHYEEKYKIRTGDYSAAFWSHYHQAAIEKLTRSRKMTLDQAIDEVVGLDFRQADGVTNGLSRSDVLGLVEWEIKALLALRDVGLTANQLREQRPYPTYFSYGHHDALIYLVRDRKLSIDNALGILRKITDPTPAMGISIGLSVEQVNKFSNRQILICRELIKNEGYSLKRALAILPSRENTMSQVRFGNS